MVGGTKTPGWSSLRRLRFHQSEWSLNLRIDSRWTAKGDALMQRLILCVALAFLGVCVIAGCTSNPGGARGNGSLDQDSRYVYGPGSQDTVFIFIHGIYGNCCDTWLNDTTKKHFYDLMHENDPFKT